LNALVIRVRAGHQPDVDDLVGDNERRYAPHRRVGDGLLVLAANLVERGSIVDRREDGGRVHAR
jgi:hypothetical protein